MIASIPILPGMDSFGPYQVLEELGAVPYGTLYRVVDSRSDEPAMLKVIPPSLQGGWQGAAPWEILLRETHALARIYHRGLPALLEVGEHEGALLVAFAPVEGMSLHDWLAEGGRPGCALLAEWGCELLEALEEAHRAGILHRHLGEEEVFVTPEGHLLLTGFGLTQLAFDPLVPLSPEQLGGDACTRQSDLYAVGSLLYRLAFVSGIKHPGPSCGAGRDPLLKVVARATFSDPAARFGSAAEMAEALREAVRARRRTGDPGPAPEAAPLQPEELETAAVAPFPPRPRGLRDEGDGGEGDRRYALLLLASSVLLMLCLILVSWLALEQGAATTQPGAPAAVPGAAEADLPLAPTASL